MDLNSIGNYVKGLFNQSKNSNTQPQVKQLPQQDFLTRVQQVIRPVQQNIQRTVNNGINAVGNELKTDYTQFTQGLGGVKQPTLEQNMFPSFSYSAGRYLAQGAPGMSQIPAIGNKLASIVPKAINLTTEIARTTPMYDLIGQQSDRIGEDMYKSAIKAGKTEAQAQQAKDLSKVVFGITFGGMGSGTGANKSYRVDIHQDDWKVMKDFALKVDELGPKSNKMDMGELGQGAQRLVERYFGKNYKNLPNTKIAQLFDFVTAKKFGNGLAIKPKGVQIPVGFATQESEGLAQQAMKAEQTGDPITNVINALKGADIKRGQQEMMYSAERGQRFAKFQQAGLGTSGKAGAIGQLSQLGGKMKKVDYQPLKVAEADVDAIFNKVKDAEFLNAGEKATGYNALLKLFGEKGTSLPTEGELKILNQVLPPEFINTVLEKRPMMQKLQEVGMAAINLPRAMMATADVSAPMRQGIFLMGSKPKQWFSSFGNMFKYAFSEKAYTGLENKIRQSPNYQLYKDTGLGITEMTRLGPKEEAFMSNLTEKIPGFGKIAKGSNRAYSGFLNQLRTSVFDDIYKGAVETGALKERPQLINDIAKFINSATGRASLPTFIERNSELMNGLFFSPRLMQSRINLLNPVFYAQLDPLVRKEALKSLFTFAGTAMSVLSLAKLGGANITSDPRSSDFGKIKVGNTRYDVLGGFGQYIRFISQFMTGSTVSAQTGKVTKIGEGYPQLSRFDMTQRFLESKEAPVASFVTSWLRGKNFLGQDFNLGAETINRLVPMVIQDMYDIAKDKQSVAAGVIMGIPGMLGVGSQTYGNQVPNMKITPAGNPTIKLSPVGGLGEDIVNKLTNTPESNIPQDQRQGLVNQIQSEKQQEVSNDQMKKDLMAGQQPTGNETDLKTAKMMFEYSPDKTKLVGNTFMYKDGDTIKTVDISFAPTEPILTGNTELDKKLTSKYKGELTSKANDILELYTQGYYTSEQAETELAKIKSISNKYTTPKQPKKVSFKKISIPKTSNIKMSSMKLPKIKLPKQPKIKSMKIKKSNLISKLIKSNIKVKA